MPLNAAVRYYLRNRKPSECAGCNLRDKKLSECAGGKFSCVSFFVCVKIPFLLARQEAVRMCGLVELELQCEKECQLTSDGPKEIAEALKENTTLTSLTLAYYQTSAGVSDAAGTAFAEALTVNTKLTKLTLGLG